MVPNGWKQKSFKDILKLDRGSSPRPIVNFMTDSDDGVNWIKIGDTKGEAAFINSTKEKITKEGAKKSREVSKGEIILSNSMSYGKPYILNIDGYIHDGWFVIRNYEQNLDKGYLIQLLGGEIVQRQYKRLAAGGVVTNISSELVYFVKVNLPPLPEQRKIAKILSTWDKAISTTERLIDNSKQQKKALMQQLLTGAHTQRKRLLDDSGKPFEGEWEEVKLGEISHITTGSSNREDSSLDGEYTFFDRSEDIRTSSRYLFDSEAVIVPGEGQDFVPKHFEGKFDLHQRTYAIMNFDGCVGRFLFYYIGYHRHYFLAQAVGSTVKSLRLPMFQKMPINLPNQLEQAKIASVLNNADREIKILQQQLADLKQEKKALMQQLLTGKRRVKI
jgi:type I restriction enzyme S subunit